MDCCLISIFKYIDIEYVYNKFVLQLILFFNLNNIIMTKQIKRDGFKLNGGRIVIDEMYYADPDHFVEPHAYGHPISVDVAELMIGNYWTDIKNQGSNVYLNKHVAFVIGKETLLSILSQKDCEAIRFYVAKWDPGLCDSPIPNSLNRAGETVVAVGAKLVKVKINDEEKTEIWDIGTKENNKLIVSPIKGELNKNSISMSSADSGEIREMVPPSTIEELKSIGSIGEYGDELGEVVDSFFP